MEFRLLMGPHDSNDWEERRVDRILEYCLREFDLDTNGLTVYTEAATGPYQYNPILAALSGAETVYARTSDSEYGTKESVRKKTEAAAERWNVDGTVEVVFEKRPAEIGEADIVTNTGFVRPIDREVASWMKPTAVIPLMWETWEHRETDVDLEACLDHDVLVMGTDESQRPLDMYRYAGFLGMKLLFELGVEGHKTNPIVLGGFEGLGGKIVTHFKDIGMDLAWFAPEGTEGARPYSDLREFVRSNGSQFDAIVIAEQRDERTLIGPDGILDSSLLRRTNPAIAVGVIAGVVDEEDLQSNDIRYHPEGLAGVGHMSYSPDELGPRPPIELFAAGLKVGQVMAQHRRRGRELDSVVEIASREAPAMAFDPPVFQ